MNLEAFETKYLLQCEMIWIYIWASVIPELPKQHK
jgi:hypothetical protein